MNSSCKSSPNKLPPSNNTDWNSLSGSRIKLKTKKRRVLEAMIVGETLNFITAQQRHSDRSLHSTIAELRRDGAIITSISDIVAGYGGTPTRCKSYWIQRNHLAQAGRVLARLK